MKYVGSKSRFADELIEVMFAEGTPKRYIEPFVGGCNVMDKVDHPDRVGVDINPYLIAMWKCLQDGVFFPKKIRRELWKSERDFWYRTREEVEDRRSKSTRELGFCGWVGFMGSFNGRFYDGGYSGHYTLEARMMHPRDRITENIRMTLSQVEKLKGVNFVAGDYSGVMPREGDLIYCDPPTPSVKRFAYQWGFDYERFWKTALEWSGMKDVTVYVSATEAPDEFEVVWEKEAFTRMALRSRKDIKEKLFRAKSEFRYHEPEIEEE